MAIVRQFGGGSYDTKDYPFVLLSTNKNEVYGRFSTLEKAHEGRLMHEILHPSDMAMLFNDTTQEFIEWRRKEMNLLDKYKNNPDKYMDKIEKKFKRGK